MIDVNEKGPLKEVAERYLKTQLLKEKERLIHEKSLEEESTSLTLLKMINKKLGMLMKQNDIVIDYLQRLANGPSGDLHYIKLINYTKTFGEVFIDFIRGEKSPKTRLPDNSEFTYPYSHVFMIKITNDGPADISFQTNRHARMIDLKAGESDTVSENENFQLTELRISNNTNNNANVRIVLYA